MLSHAALRRKSTIALMHKILWPIRRMMVALNDLPLHTNAQYAGRGDHTVEDTALALRKLLPSLKRSKRLAMCTWGVSPTIHLLGELGQTVESK